MQARAPAANKDHEVTLRTKATGLVDGAQGGRSPALNEQGAATSGQLSDPGLQALFSDTRACDSMSSVVSVEVLVWAGMADFFSLN